jgi:hypothetical protein
MQLSIVWVVGAIVIVLLLLLSVPGIMLCFWAGFRMLTFKELTTSRRSQIGRGSGLFACGLALLIVPIVYSPEILNFTPPIWLRAVSTVFPYLALAMAIIALAFLLPDAIAEARRQARKTRESGEGFWIGRHGDG